MPSGLNQAISANTGFFTKLFSSGNKDTKITPFKRPELTGPTTLKSSNSTGCWLIGSLFFCIFWNGIVSIFFMSILNGWMKGDPDWFQTLFFIPFGLVGLALILTVLYFFLALFNPKPVLTIEESVIPLGGSVQLLWQIDGKASAFQRVRIALIGTESATYQQGTDTVTVTEEFYEKTLFETEDKMEMTDGRIDVEIPALCMHSWSANNNNVSWKLHLHGDIPKWPDVKSDFDIQVVPIPVD